MTSAPLGYFSNYAEIDLGTLVVSLTNPSKLRFGTADWQVTATSIAELFNSEFGGVRSFYGNGQITIGGSSPMPITWAISFTQNGGPGSAISCNGVLSITD